MKKEFWLCLLFSLVFAFSLPLISYNTWAKTTSNIVAQDSFSAEVQSAPSAAEKTVRAIVERVSARLQKPDAPFVLMVQIRAKPGFVGRVIASYSEQARQAASNPGSSIYELNQDTDNPTRFVLYERWANLDAFIAHETASFTLEHFERVAPMLEASRQLYVLSPLITSKTS